jgi:hypothetical protein
MIRRVVRAVVAAVLTLSPQLLLAGGGTEPRLLEDGLPADETRIVVTGTLRRVGAEPFTELVVTPPGGPDFYLPAESIDAFKAYEQLEVTALARLRRLRMVLADGRDLGSRYLLIDAELWLEEQVPSDAIVVYSGSLPGR